MESIAFFISFTSWSNVSFISESYPNLVSSFFTDSKFLYSSTIKFILYRNAFSKTANSLNFSILN